MLRFLIKIKVSNNLYHNDFCRNHVNISKYLIKINVFDIGSKNYFFNVNKYTFEIRVFKV